MLTTYAFAIMLAILVSTSIAGLPIGISMIVSSVFYLFLAGRDVGLAAENVLNAIFGNYVALSVPLFIFAANIMNAGKVSDRLLTFCLALVGRSAGRFGAGRRAHRPDLLGHERFGHRRRRRHRQARSPT